MKTTRLIGVIALLVAAPCMATKTTEATEPAQQADADFNRRFADKFYQVLGWIDQDARDDAKTENMMADHAKKLEAHESRLGALEIDQLIDESDRLSLTELQIELRNYKKEESTRLVVASAVGGCIAAAIGGIVYWLKH